MTNSTEPWNIGWVDQPNTRGTFDIIWSCLFTIFLCIWSVQCLNLPATEESYWIVVRRKFRWALLGLFGPDFLLTFAIGQWASAQRSVEAFASIGHKEWTMTHAFFADMGGFMVKTASGKSYPVNALQLHYLVYTRSVTMPETKKEDIADKSKGDGWTKAIVCLQTAWFLLQCLGRAITSLATTTLELSTVAFVLCSLATYHFWYFKPQDVSVPISIYFDDISHPLPTKRAASPCSGREELTPLDFVDNLRPSWSLTIMPHLWAPNAGHKSRPLQRLPNDRLPQIGIKAQIILRIVTMLYACIHMIGWHFGFSSVAEKWLWRASASVHVLATTTFWVVDETHRWYKKEHVGPRYKSPLAKTRVSEATGSRDAVIQVDQVDEVATPDQDPRSDSPPSTSVPGSASPASSRQLPDGQDKLEITAEPVSPEARSNTLPIDYPTAISSYDVPQWEVWATIFGTTIYLLARGYLIVEVFLGLRALPMTAFETVQWSECIPHF